MNKHLNDAIFEEVVFAAQKQYLQEILVLKSYTWIYLRIFDETQVAYRDLLEVFFATHDPITLNRCVYPAILVFVVFR